MKSFIINNWQRIVNIITYPELLRSLDKKMTNRTFVRELLFIEKRLHISPQTIIDVGASTGEFVKAARFVFPVATIYAFEPIPASFRHLIKLNDNDNNLFIYNYALSMENTLCSFNLNEFSLSSSLLSMTPRHKELFPHTKNETIIQVECRRLDSINNLKLKKPVFLKIDVQGAELQVLKGGEDLVKDFDLIQLEVSFEIFYQGQAQFLEIMAYMRHLGFKSFLQMDPQFSNEIPSYPIFCDLLFFKG